MFKVDELLIKCLELTKTEAYTRNTSMWTQAADSLYNFIEKKTNEKNDSIQDKAVEEMDSMLAAREKTERLVPMPSMLPSEISKKSTPAV